MNTPPIDRLLYRICYAETTPESAEHGENSDSGVHEDEWSCDTFDDVISMVKMFGEESWSSSPHNKGQHDWLMSSWSVQDYATMTERQTTIHALNDRSLKYLEKAWDSKTTWSALR